MEKTSNHYILILCGGSGPRLWPLSRASKPKQFLTLFENKTLIENTYNRFLKIVPRQNIFFVSNKKYLLELKKVFGKKVSPQNFISEPDKKNTAMAILLGTYIIQKINPEATITATPSDHFIDKINLFCKDITLAYTLADSTDKIVTIGITPTFPNPAYGYILPERKTKSFYPVAKFIEKPSVIDANLYLRKDAFWNSGIYTFKINTILYEFQTHQLQYFSLYKQLSKNISTVYQQSPTLPIDKAISEISTNMITISARFEWSDVGQWQTIWEKLTKDKQGIATINRQTKYVGYNSKNCLLNGSNKKLIGMVGLNNLAIIDTPDSLLVCNLHDSYSVRDLISTIVANPLLKNYFLKNND